jgi:hypothetical protein
LVGVRHQQVERAIAEILLDVDDGVVPVTVGINVGYLGGASSFRSFSFARVSGDALVSAGASACDAFVEAIRTLGVPYMERMRTLSAMAEHFDGPRCRMSEDAAYRRPVVARLRGREGEALVAVQAWEAQLGDRHDPAAERYRRFAEGFRRREGRTPSL